MIMIKTVATYTFWTQMVNTFKDQSFFECNHPQTQTWTYAVIFKNAEFELYSSSWHYKEKRRRLLKSNDEEERVIWMYKTRSFSSKF